jgi:hypothetical protein
MRDSGNSACPDEATSAAEGVGDGPRVWSIIEGHYGLIAVDGISQVSASRPHAASEGVLATGGCRRARGTETGTQLVLSSNREVWPSDGTMPVLEPLLSHRLPPPQSLLSAPIDGFHPEDLLAFRAGPHLDHRPRQDGKIKERRRLGDVIEVRPSFKLIPIHPITPQPANPRST